MREVLVEVHGGSVPHGHEGRSRRGGGLGGGGRAGLEIVRESHGRAGGTVANERAV